MADDELDLFGLFVALGEARVTEARAAIAAGDDARRAGALIPLAVDAALLGAEGVFELARSLANPPRDVSKSALSSAMETLAAAVASLGHGDASGARAEEAKLLDLARALGRAKSEPPPVVAAPAAAGDETHWIPSLPEDLIGPFLDECHERIEGLSSKLLELEQEG